MIYDDLHKVIFDLHISLHNAKRLAQDAKDKYEAEVLDYGFLQLHWYQLWSITSIQLAKLFDENKNQKRNFHKLCNCLENSPYGLDLKKQLEKNKKSVFPVFTSKKEIIDAVKETRKDLADNKDLIEKAVAIRDKAFAHIDKDAKLVIKDIKLSEIETLINLSTTIFHRLLGQLFDRHMNFHINADWHIDPIIDELSRYRKYLYEEYNKKKRIGAN